jgi:hypothetical protein
MNCVTLECYQIFIRSLDKKKCGFFFVFFRFFYIPSEKVPHRIHYYHIHTRDSVIQYFKATLIDIQIND